MSLDLTLWGRVEKPENRGQGLRPQDACVLTGQKHVASGEASFSSTATGSRGLLGGLRLLSDPWPVGQCSWPRTSRLPGWGPSLVGARAVPPRKEAAVGAARPLRPGPSPSAALSRGRSPRVIPLPLNAGSTETARPLPLPAQALARLAGVPSG